MGKRAAGSDDAQRRGAASRPLPPRDRLQLWSSGKRCPEHKARPHAAQVMPSKGFWRQSCAMQRFFRGAVRASSSLHPEPVWMETASSRLRPAGKSRSLWQSAQVGNALCIHENGVSMEREAGSGPRRGPRAARQRPSPRCAWPASRRRHGRWRVRRR